MSFQKKSGWIVSFILIMIPALIWLFISPLADRFSTFSSILTSLGQISGLTGLAMFAVTLILMSRIKFLEKHFAGLEEMYNAHHLLGGISLILLLFHPLFLAGKYFLFSPYYAALFLLPSSDWGINFGIFALLLMILLLVLTFFTKLIYETWKLTHKFLGLAFVLGSLHAFLVPSDISRNLVLKLYILILVIISLLIFFYRSLLNRWLVKKYKYIVDSVDQLGENTIEISFSPQNEVMDYQPGQFVFIEFYQKGIPVQTHPFSISSAPSPRQLKIALKYLGDYTSKLKQLKPQAIAKIEGPFGVFSHQSVANKKQVWIGGGIGITPFLSMARSLLDDKEYSIDLFYCAKNESEAVLLPELKKISQQNKNIRLISYQSAKQDHLTAKKISELIADLSQKDIFICGPSAMMKSLKKQLIRQGIQPNKIHTEEFQLY